jgi:hypothetical protein
MIVWVLMVFFQQGSPGGPVLIDNIVSEAECRRMEDYIHKNPIAPVIKSICAPIRKA